MKSIHQSIRLNIAISLIGFLSLGVFIQSFAQSTADNYVKVYKAITPMPGDLSIVNDKDSVTETIQYFDGLGRPIQSTTRQGSPSGQDIVNFFVYDSFGRKTKQYLPYVSATTNGSLIETPIPQQQSFYQDMFGVSDGQSAIAETIIERSDLSRVLEQGAPGSAWQPDNADTYNAPVDRSIKKAYEFNVANEVLLWTFTPPDATYLFGKVNAGTTATPVYYGANQLYKNKTKDEERHEVIEYVDKQGRTVLKRVQAVSGTPSSSDANKDSNFASTYYIYDDFGNLVCVIPPEATKRLATEYYQSGSTDATKDAFLKRWAFRYAHDARKRMTMKQVPGADAIYMIYDNRDRLVMTQDGVQRLSSPYRWLFTKYDELNRPILTGIKDTTALLSQTVMQNVVDTYYSLIDSTKPWRNYSETFVGASGPVHGYTNKSYPQVTTATTLNANQYLTVTYYDNYDFKATWPDDYDYKNESLSQTSNGVYYQQPSGENLSVVGHVTGSKVRVDNVKNTGGIMWFKTVNYFDNKYRTVQSISQNYKLGTSVTTNLYDFVGRVLITKQTDTDYDFLWQNVGNCTIVNYKLTKVGSSGGNAGGTSDIKIGAGENAWLEFTPSGSQGWRAIGLSDYDVNFTLGTIDYGFYLQYGPLFVYENGVSKYSVPGGYTNSDVLRIERVGSTIYYKKNSVTVYTSTVPSNTQLVVDAYISGSGAEFNEVKFCHPKSSNTVERTFEYDHSGRLLNTYHSVNDEPMVLLSALEYNEIGQLVTKKLHSESEGDFKQHIDMRYNIRGWLERMNNSDLSPDNAFEPHDLFGMELAYNNDIGIGTVSPQFNGNISAMKWSANLGLGDEKERGYIFGYDPLNRLLAADHQLKATTWNASNSFHENGITYDLNGNIQSLNRKGKYGSNMDALSYTYNYGSLGNKLTKVTDAGDRNEGFKELGAASNDYVYDANGNLVWDANKGGKEMLTNGDFENGSDSWTLSGETSRLTFANGEVQITPGSSSVIIQQLSCIAPNLPYVIEVDLIQTSSAGKITVRVGNGLTDVSGTGKIVITPTANSGTDIRLIPTAPFAGKIKSISVKGVTVISYNYLNLPVTVTQSGDHQLKYIYDAIGRKLSQLLLKNGITQKTTDYVGEFIYENDTLIFLNTEEGRIITKHLTVQKSVVAEYKLDGDAVDVSGNGLTGVIYGGAATTSDRNEQINGAIMLDGSDDYVEIPNNAAFNFSSQNFTVSFWVKKLSNSVSWDNNVGICKWNTGAAPGTNSWALSLASSSDDNIPSFNIEVGSTVYKVTAVTSLALNQWYQIKGEKSGKTLKIYVNGVLEGVNQINTSNVTVNTTTLPLYIGRLPQGHYTNAVFDDVQIESETQILSTSPEYEYHLKDHLGNVRLTFTTKQEEDEAIATLEPVNTLQEQSEFLRYSEAKLINSSLFDKTNGASTGYAQRLNGTATEKFGLAKSISVMPGDTVSVEVYAKYVDTNTANWTAALNSLMSQIGSGEPGVVVDGANYASSTTSFPFAGLLDTGGSSSNGPKAYLNWLVFDRDYNLQLNGTGYMRMSDAAKEYGQDVAHERLYSPEVIIKEPGYVYIYLSNEEPEASPVEVYFDELKVTHIKSPVVQMDNYYPFGLTFNSYSRESSVPNQYLYNGKERQDELDLGWLDYGARMYMPELGRWAVVDPLTEMTNNWSPYAYAFNSPIYYIDPSGMLNAGFNDSEKSNLDPNGMRFWEETKQEREDKLISQRIKNKNTEEKGDCPECDAREQRGIEASKHGFFSKEYLTWYLTEGLEYAVDKILPIAGSGQVDGNASLNEKATDIAVTAGFAKLTAGIYALKRPGAFRSAKRHAKIPVNQQPASVTMVPMTDRNGKAILNASGKPIMTREYKFVNTEGNTIIIQDHSAGHTFGEGGVGDQGPHFNVRPVENTRNGSVPGTQAHYPFSKD